MVEARHNMAIYNEDLSSDVILTQDTDSPSNKLRQIVQNPQIKQRIRVARNLPRSAVSYATTQQILKVNRGYARALVSNITLSHLATRTIYDRSLVSNIALTQSVSRLRIIERNISHLALLSQTLHRNIIKTEQIVQTIVFKDTKTINFYNDTVTIPTVQYVVVNPDKLTNARLRGLFPSDAAFELYKKGIIVNSGNLLLLMPHITSSNNFIILYTDQEAITLPAPTFGNSENKTGTFNLRKAMDGTIYTYVKKQSTHKLKYDLEIDRQKALQLRQYILAANSKNMTLANWKGEIWKVKFLTNPFVSTTTKRWAPVSEAVSITLEFEGIKVN